MSTASAPVTTQAQRTELTILEKLDRKVAGELSISATQGGMTFANMGEVLEFAKLMSVSQHAVPPHCRNQPGLCLGLAIQAIEWRMSPYAVASKSYVVNDRIGYESQLVHAVIEQRAPIKSRLRHEFSGEGNKRRCRVWATPKNEDEPLEYTSPEFGTITPKNSPLWKSKPDLQLYYNTSRDWARAYFPDVIMGVYAEDELDSMPGSQAIDKPRGIAGLKQQLVGGPEDNPADDRQQEKPDEAEGVDPPSTDEVDQRGPEDDVNQAPTMSAEELADMERERQQHSGRTKQGSLVDGGPAYE